MNYSIAAAAIRHTVLATQLKFIEKWQLKAGLK